MEQIRALTDRIRLLKSIAASMHEGAIHTRLVPEVDKVLALPDKLDQASLGEREAVSRQVREYEQAFDRLGYTLLDQIMPATGVSPVFRIVQAADEFKLRVRDEALSRYSLSIGTPPVTAAMRALVARTLFGVELPQLAAQLEVLPCDRRALASLLDCFGELVDGSLHYSTNAEEKKFLAQAARFVNFEGASLFNRVVITESPERVTHLIRHHVFDKFGALAEVPVRLIDEADRIDAELIAQMQASPNTVFVAAVTRIPHGLFASAAWQGLIGRLVLIDVSERARRSNTTIVYTLFPHVARTLRNVQTSFAGRPANTQMALRTIFERFPAASLRELRAGLTQRLGELSPAFDADVEQLRSCDWKRNDFFAALSIAKLRRIVTFLERAPDLRKSVAELWMKYFYPRLDYRAAVLPGGGRGALRLVGEYHRDEVRAHLQRFVSDELPACRERLAKLKAQLAIPSSSSDEIVAAARQSELRSLAPSQWTPAGPPSTRSEYVVKTLSYRVADLATRFSQRASNAIDKAAFGNVTGPLAALLKSALGAQGFGALHGHLERAVVDRAQDLDRELRLTLAPLQAALRTARHAAEEVKSGSDPDAIGEIEAVLQVIERGAFYPTLVLPEMSWTYGDVFPEKDYPAASVVRIPLNERHEMDPGALLERIEALRYLFRRFPEIFKLFCRSMIVVVNSPHNPTGVVWRRETVLRLLQIAAGYDLTILDDDSYHKILTRRQKAREGDASVAQIYEQHREHLGASVAIHTVHATTKALQGAGDRTGLLHSNVARCVEFAEEHASQPHLMSLYLTQLKLESGLACKRYTRALEALAADVLAPPIDGVRALLTEELAGMTSEDAPVAAFQTLLEGYEELLRLQQRGAGVKELHEALSALVRRLKLLRLEKALCDDIERRVAAFLDAAKDRDVIEPGGAFYGCVRLCAPDNERGVVEFLQAIARHRKVDVTYAGRGYVRVSLGGELPGGDYEKYSKAVKQYLDLLFRYWDAYEAGGRDVGALDKLFEGKLEEDLAPLRALHSPSKRPPATPIDLSERGIVYCIEEGRSVADKVFVSAQRCESVDELLHSRTFRVVYRRLLKKVYRRIPALADIGFDRAENQYGALACLSAYRDRQLIDDVFRQLLALVYGEWHGAGTVKVLLSRLEAGPHAEKVAALHGVDRKINDLINELMHAFDIPRAQVQATSTFAIGCEALDGVRPHPALPPWLRTLISGCSFAGATAALDPRPSYVTGAAKRVSDHRYGFTRREGPDFRERLALFVARADPSDYVCKSERVGPFRMLVVIHKSCFHLISDELRLYPQIDEPLHEVAWDGVLLFGIPATAMGESFRTGYVLDSPPVAWVAREDATDYVGFFKKSLLTLHNERVKAMGGMPVHGAMITITFKNGLRKTLVFSADSGTGKSETITAMMEQAIGAEGPAAELQHIDVLSGDMLSMWRGEDGQLYAFGTETGDFLRLSDITESWKARFGDLLERGSYSNLDHPTNPRVTIPGICDPRKLLSPTRVNCFFYIDNYSPPNGSAVELSEDPHHVLRHVLVRGLRKNKGTSGDQPSVRAGLEFAGASALVTRFRHRIDELLDWQERGGKTVLCYRDGIPDVFAATEIVRGAFAGRRVEYDVLRNLFLLDGAPLDREAYDAVFEPLVSTFCGNPFVDPPGMDRVLETFAETMRAAKVQTGVLKTQLAREGYEFAGPARASRDVVTFLLEDEEVNARFQRNKNKVQRAMERTFAGVIESGTNLPVELEGYNLLLLEAHESTHVAFVDLGQKRFTLSTPCYRYQQTGGEPKPFVPAIALPEIVDAIADIRATPDELDLSELRVDLRTYDRIRSWRSLEELTYQVLLVDGVVTLGSSDRELARFPAEVRKAAEIAAQIVKARGAHLLTGAA